MSKAYIKKIAHTICDHKYYISTIILFVILVISNIKNIEYAFTLKPLVTSDSFYLRLPSILIVILVVQLSLILITNKNINLMKAITVTLMSNLIGIFFVFFVLAVKYGFYSLLNFDISYFVHLVLVKLKMPSSMIWFHPGTFSGNESIYYNSLPSAIIFVFISTAITSCLMWLWLKRDMNGKKKFLLLNSIFSFVLYSAISIYMWFAY